MSVILCGLPEARFAIMAMCGWCGEITKSVSSPVYGGWCENRVCSVCGCFHMDGEWDGRAVDGSRLAKRDKDAAEAAEHWAKHGDQKAEYRAYIMARIGR